MKDLWMADFERALDEMQREAIDAEQFRTRMRGLGLDDDEIDEHLVAAGAALV